MAGTSRASGRGRWGNKSVAGASNKSGSWVEIRGQGLLKSTVPSVLVEGCRTALVPYGWWGGVEQALCCGSLTQAGVDSGESIESIDQLIDSPLNFVFEEFLLYADLLGLQPRAFKNNPFM